MTELIEKNAMNLEDEKEISFEPVENAWNMEIPSFSKGEMKYHMQEETKFEIAFPKYREKYIRECWPLVQKLFDEHGIKAELNLLEGIMSVATTRKTWDPYIILKSRDIIKLLGRSVPVEHAVKVLKDGVTCEIIKIKNLVRNRERFIKRRQRLIGSNGTALKALELLTDCYVLVQGCTVSAIGPHKGVQQVVRVVLDTMRNIHPINLLKVLMVKRTLAQDPIKKYEDWTKYIPSYSSTNVKRKKPKKVRNRKPYTPFPPEVVESKTDEQLVTGKFYTEKDDLVRKRWQMAKDEKKRKREEERNKVYQAPVEPDFKSQSITSTSTSDVDIQKLKRKLKNN